LPGDIRLLRRAIVNLLANAIKYTPAKGTISVAVKSEGDMASVEIADTGKGVAPEDLPHIFERFFRSAACAGSESEGAGLGLSIVKMIVELHGGKVAVENNHGGGTVFRLALPTAGS
jgi:signal transduction histidine kinase